MEQERKQADPKVSVIIPVWNPGDGIRRCVDSLRGQTLTDIEMIFVDDCGTDGAMDVVRAAAAEDPRIRIVTNAENVGPGISRNAGIEVARGEYLSFVDADDYVSPNFLEVLYTKAKSEDLDIVKGRIVCELEDGTEAAHADLNEQIQICLQKGKSLFRLFTYQHQSAIYRRSLLEKYGIRYGASHNGEDVTFLLKVCHRAMHFGFEECAEYHFREKADSLMHDMHPRTLERLLHAFSEQMDYIVENMLGEKDLVYYMAGQVSMNLRFVAHYGKNRDCADSVPPFVHGVRSQLLRLPVADVDKLKGEKFVIKALCDHEVALAEVPFTLPWEKFKAADYVETLSEWMDFIVGHTEHLWEAKGDIYRLFRGAREISLKLGVPENPELTQKAKKSISEQMKKFFDHGMGEVVPPDKCLWYCAEGFLPIEYISRYTQNYDEMLNCVKHQLNTSNQLMANQHLEEANGIVCNLGHFLRLSPEIQSWAENSREVDVRGVYDYGVVLRPRLWGEYRTVPEYAQMLRNWRGFLRKHPDSASLYIGGYKSFLNDARAFIKERVQNDVDCAEIAELKDALEKGWRVLPFRVRMRKWKYMICRFKIFA